MNIIIIIVTFVLFAQYVFLVIAITEDCLRYLGIKTKIDFLLWMIPLWIIISFGKTIINKTITSYRSLE